MKSRCVTKCMWGFRCDCDWRLTRTVTRWQMLPLLRDIPLSEVLSLPELPTTKIKTDNDLEHWKSMQSYRDYILFLRRLNESVVGTSLPWIPEHHSQVWFVLAYFSESHISAKKSLWIGYLFSSILLNNGASRSRLLNHLSALGTWLSEHGVYDWRRLEFPFPLLIMHINQSSCCRGLMTCFGHCWHLNMLQWYPT